MESADKAPCVARDEASSLQAGGSVRQGGGLLFPTGTVSSGSPSEPQGATVKVVFLTINDVYELFPDSNGVGGVAEFATMLQTIKQRIPTDSHIIVTLNGDFLWRSELDRKDKGAHMVELLNYLGIEYVVLGNHEFDFGAEHMKELLDNAQFTCFGSNVRCSSNRDLFPGLTDTCIIQLRNGFRLGLFGVTTTVTAKDPFAGPSVIFEDERPHARRCVEELKGHGADAIVALTHFKVAEDIRLAMQATGIDLILGGHDHEPMTCAAGQTLIHKSGMDALWLGVVEMTLTKHAVPRVITPVRVDFQWHMLLNKGYAPDPNCLAMLNEYARFIQRDEEAQGKLEPLGVSLTALDGRRITCRTQESNMGNLVADSLREGLKADIGLVNAGYIKGDMLNDPELVITRKWLERYLPLVKPTVVVALTLGELKDALEYWLRRYPAMSSSQPHFSGVRVIYDMTQPQSPVISSIKLVKEKYESESTSHEGESNEGMDIDMTHTVTVAMPLLSSMDGWRFFANAQQLRSGPIVRDLVEEFVRTRQQISYAPQEGRLIVLTSPPPSPASSL